MPIRAEAPNKNSPIRRRVLAAGTAIGLTLTGAAIAAETAHLTTHQESIAVTPEQQRTLLFGEALKFYRFLDELKPGELTNTPPPRFQRVITLRDGEPDLNPVSPLKVDVAGQIVSATQTLLAATGGNPQNAEALMGLYDSLTTPATRRLLGNEGIHVTIARPTNDGLGASGVDGGQYPDGHIAYHAEFVTPAYGNDSGGNIVWPAGPMTADAQAHFRDQLAAFQQHLAPQA